MKTILLALLLGVTVPLGAQQPNILLLTFDDLRPELGCYGATHMVTPHLDTLASQGRLFRNHYVGVPTCGASRYSLMTGLRPTSATDDNSALIQNMPTSYPANPESWVDLLRRNGWHTASIGKVTDQPDGYYWHPSSNYDLYDLYDPAAIPPANPPHKPVGAEPGSTNQTSEPNSYTASSRSDRDVLRRAYFACVSYVDAQVGKVLDELEALGLADNTIVIVWGDHGYNLDDYSLLAKHVVLEHAVESPLIMRLPADQRTEAYDGISTLGIAETIDIYPTIAELCGLMPPASVKGASLVPQLRNPLAPGKEYAFSRFGGVTTIRTLDWRLIKTGGTYDLYDLSSERYEHTDVSAANPDVVSELSGKINVQGTRPPDTTTYIDWAAGNPDPADPAGDADHDGCSNVLEYASGTNALDPSSRSVPSLTVEDLSSFGLSESEIVYSFTAATLPDDLTLVPSTSPDLLTWSFAPLEYLDATDLGNGTSQLRFRLPTPGDPRRFFRSATTAN